MAKNLTLTLALVLAGAVLIDKGAGGIKTAFGNITPGGSTPPSSTPGYLGGSAPSKNLGGYANPFARASNLQPGRIDQGADFSGLSPGDPIAALADSKIVGITPNWYNGQPAIFTQILTGPDAGKFVYYAEQLDPTVQVGDIVNAGQQIATYAPNGTGLELGWAANATQTLAAATTGYQEGEATPAGQSFRAFLTLLGVPA